MLCFILVMILPWHSIRLLKQTKRSGLSAVTCGCLRMSRPLTLCMLFATFSYIFASTEVCTNSFLPGAKGDQGEAGEVGEQGKLGKTGPPGHSGVPGEPGLKGEVGQTGKMGPFGDKGDKGQKGFTGAVGLKGKTGTTCDCGRYRKVVGQLDVSVGKLRKAVQFVKNVVLSLKETEESYYLLVKEPKRFREASVNCKLRGGTLAMPKTSNINRLLADFISQAGLTRVYVGVQAQSTDSNGTISYVYADSSPLQEFAAWSQGSRLSPTTNSSCVEMLSTGTWTHMECETTLFFICEFPKTSRGGGEGGRGPPALA
ncbi:collectin-10 [Austrofundulus limnaeus]|uniref:Collectin-10 n=1 Tax=Austrofundulus limnaeus TaxID=52670 RepID=A0A2I4BPL4_AUSLI|nr:PREDICTED: collectin-10-like [Austrofundulus limnaeus]